MRLPAQRSLEHQAAYPSQAEGGFAGDLHNSLRLALDRWEKRRGINGHFKYGRGNGVFRREKAAIATRAEISWNAAPEVKREPKKREYTEQQRQAVLERRRERRATESKEAREQRLKLRRAAYLAKNGGVVKKRRAQTPEERRAAVKAAKARYLERQRQGLVAKTARKPSKLTPEQLKRKAERQRVYAAKNKIIRTA